MGSRSKFVEGQNPCCTVLDKIERDGTVRAAQGRRHNPMRFGIVYDSAYQSTLDAVYVYVLLWSELPILPSCPYICSAMVGVPHRAPLPSLPTGLLACTTKSIVGRKTDPQYP